MCTLHIVRSWPGACIGPLHADPVVPSRNDRVVYAFCALNDGLNIINTHVP